MVEISLTGDQMLNVLEAIAEHGPVSTADIARICDLNRTVVHRLINTLMLRAYVRRSPEGYVLGSRVLDLSRRFDLNISGIARPFLEKLAKKIGETVVLHCIYNDEAIVTEQALGNKHLIRVQHTPGSRHPLTSGASGWSLLAFQNDDFIDRMTSNSTNPDQIRERVSRTRQQGYAISHDELQMGVHGLAVPVLDQESRCGASVAVLVPARRGEDLEALLPELKATAASIEDVLRPSPVTGGPIECPSGGHSQ